jgi:uncharacterized cupin superfamily protein
MKSLKSGLLVIGVAISASAVAEVPARPHAANSIVKFSGDELHALLKSETATKKTTAVRTTTSLPMFKSGDERFSSGVFSSTAGYAEFESYAGDEFCYIVAGEATITSADGSVIKVKAGDAITIPKGWKGRWDTSGYTKYFVSYKSSP